MKSPKTFKSIIATYYAGLAPVLCAAFFLASAGCEGTEIIADLEIVRGTDNTGDLDNDSDQHEPGWESGEEDTDDTSGSTEEYALPCGSEARGERGEDLRVESQAEMQGLFGVQRIRGNLIIGGTYNEDIVALNDLRRLLCVDGDLVITDNKRLGPDSLWGFAMLWNIGGDLIIKDNDNLPTCDANDFAGSFIWFQQKSLVGEPCVKDNLDDECWEQDERYYQAGCDFD